jgi:hypothetical protein
VEEIDLNEEEEAALERAWANLDREAKAGRVKAGRPPSRE